MEEQNLKGKCLILDLLSVVQDKVRGMRGQGGDLLLVARFFRHNGLIG